MVNVCEEEYVGSSPKDESLTLTRYHSCMKPLTGGSVTKSTT